MAPQALANLAATSTEALADVGSCATTIARLATLLAEVSIVFADTHVGIRLALARPAFREGHLPSSNLSFVVAHSRHVRPSHPPGADSIVANILRVVPRVTHAEFRTALELGTTLPFVGLPPRTLTLHLLKAIIIVVLPTTTSQTLVASPRIVRAAALYALSIASTRRYTPN